MKTERRGVVVPLSLRATMPWELHRMLEAAPEHEAFANAVLQRLAVVPSRHPALRKAILARMPKELDELDMNELLTTLEELVPIRWHDDITRAPKALEEALVSACVRVLENVERPAVPKAVARQLMIEVKKLARKYIPLSLAAELAKSVDRTVARELIRGPGRDLAVAQRVVAQVARIVRLRFEG